MSSRFSISARWSQKWETLLHHCIYRLNPPRPRFRDRNRRQTDTETHTPTIFHLLTSKWCARCKRLREDNERSASYEIQRPSHTEMLKTILNRLISRKTYRLNIRGTGSPFNNQKTTWKESRLSPSQCCSSDVQLITRSVLIFNKAPSLNTLVMTDKQLVDAANSIVRLSPLHLGSIFLFR